MISHFLSSCFYRAHLASQASSYVANGNSIAGSQIEIVDQMQVKVNELCMKIDELERELNLKTGAVDRKFNLHLLLFERCLEFEDLGGVWGICHNRFDINDKI